MAGEALTVLFDKQGIPYHPRNGFKFTELHESAWRAPDIAPDGKYLPGADRDGHEVVHARDLSTEHLVGTEFSHHQQQMLAMQKLREDFLGFNTVVVATVNYSDGPRDLYLHANGSWEEVAV